MTNFDQWAEGKAREAYGELSAHIGQNSCVCATPKECGLARKSIIVAALKEAAELEREECAKLLDDEVIRRLHFKQEDIKRGLQTSPHLWQMGMDWAIADAKAIRARGKNE